MARKNLLKGFKKPKGVDFVAEVSDESHGKFIASPFETGFGTTIGNCLRRVLLSSIQGYAITSVRITTYDADGVGHSISSEFESIPHVREDTLEILNNLKQIRLLLPEEEEEGAFTFEFQGPCTITGADLEKEYQLQILSKDVHIMEMMEGAHVEFEVNVKFGRGYVPAETNEQYVEVVGTIPLDSIFSPVLKVRYEIQPCRVGQRNDYDKLVLEIWTDGTVRPEDALAEAAKIAKDHFSIFVNFDESVLIGEDDADEDDAKIRDLLNTKISEVDFSVRARNCLANIGVKTLGELTKISEQTLASTRNVGKKSLSEIQGKLQEYNLRLGMTDYSHLKDTNKLVRQKEETDEA
ncbi:DNA-directed RNA polymerase subunit alpha [Treponema phagedenis]|uniref:DNA-directed RNA polymerase subunit alpha n=1 Tax=Treponema phagedenis TaxID=162 RepID=A0A0B7GX48_TREPH|nr:DNA-directed RNA polymerase subunit alpha [Treponema phagedenis]NVP24173.1 DNA-directed RNA polymerase subunit alpha [Treponema phagedenis]QEJ96327.1 DNA-directed RNA polymerase subunit alpha [Treponema phagedenis]QEJ99265.1 DNA-directed RNA polymerase subunit alpha [Treponema phagedenis]QEK00104.1 DNA-directed RNA polymerase subunit alpha [Treponema phagedenis]QEK04836.1 DNA-directed RNA polymerase subunit alpha [Treponema phagedenis]